MRSFDYNSNYKYGVTLFFEGYKHWERQHNSPIEVDTCMHNSPIKVDTCMHNSPIEVDTCMHVQTLCTDGQQRSCYAVLGQHVLLHNFI